MLTARRYPLAPDRTLLVSHLDGLMVLSVRGPGDVPISGPLSVRMSDAGAFVAALANETGSELANDMERVRVALRASPAIAGYKRLRASLVGMSMERRRAAVRALLEAGEIGDEGERGRPRLHLIAAEPGYSHRNPPPTGRVDLGPCPTATVATASGHAVAEPEGTTP